MNLIQMMAKRLFCCSESKVGLQIENLAPFYDSNSWRLKAFVDFEQTKPHFL